MRERRSACRMLVERPEGKGLFRRPRHMWEENIKLILKKWNGQVKIELIRLRT